MDLKRTPDYYRQQFWKNTPTILLISGGGAAVLDLLIPQISIITGIVIGAVIFYQVMLLASRWKQLAALVVLIFLTGAIPSLILRLLCLVFDSEICTSNALQTETLGFFAVPAVVIVLGWASTFWINHPRRPL